MHTDYEHDTREYFFVAAPGGPPGPPGPPELPADLSFVTEIRIISVVDLGCHHRICTLRTGSQTA